MHKVQFTKGYSTNNLFAWGPSCFLCFTSQGNQGRFPFDQIFQFEIPGIPCDEWNSIFRFVGLTRPRFQVSRENTKSNGRLFYLCLLALGLLDDSEVKINDGLDEGHRITFIVRIERSPRLNKF